MAQPIKKILILGGGISSLATALALHAAHLSSPNALDLDIEIYELRPEPSTLGGAVNLTPNVLRYLDEFGVTHHLRALGCDIPYIGIYALRTGKLLGKIDYDDEEKFKFKALRVLRHDLMECMLQALEGARANLHYGKRATKISSDEAGVRVEFEDGHTAEGDILLGCDGIHSFARTNFVEPDRKPIYTGISAANGFAESSCFTTPPPFDTTAMYSGATGSVIMSYYKQDRSKVYGAGVMQTEEAKDKDGWRLRGKDQENLKQTMLARFGGSVNKHLDEYLKNVTDWTLYPVFKLPPHGKWYNDRCILLGDAAHAMPPQGESVGICVEDAVLFAELLKRNPSISYAELFSTQESHRRDRVEKIYEETSWGFNTVKDKSWVAGLAMEYLTGAFLWFKKGEKQRNNMFDVRSVLEKKS